MSTKMTSQKFPSHSRMPQSRSSNFSLNDDSSSGAEPAARKLKKSTGTSVDGETNISALPYRTSTERRPSISTRRRQSIREHSNANSSFRAADHTRRATINPTTTANDANDNSHLAPRHRAAGSGSRLNYGNTPLLDQASKDENQTPPDSSFLAPINFDDFHNSIMAREPSLSQFPMPGQGGLRFDGKSNNEPKPTNTRWSSNQPPRTGPHGRNGNIVRRSSNASRPSTSQNPPATASMPPPPPPSGPRTRRQSYVPASSASLASSRPPRKSIGPGAFVSDGEQPGLPRRRPSLSTRRNTSDTSRPSHSQQATPRASQQSTDSGSQETNSTFLNAPRYQKARSLQPPSRSRRESMATPSNGSDHGRSPSNSGLRTPGKTGSSRTNTPSSNKRLSMMPAHAHGLGARTISPTDARRMKRMSLLPHPPPMPHPHTPPTQQEIVLPRPRSSAQSPSMIPRKSVTPSSSRTTPEHNRKSYSSGISLSSNTSYNSVRNSSGSLQSRLSQNLSSSRLPTPKPRHESAPSNDEEEEVPPVPAIPKAYESPKGEGEPIHYTPRKSSLPPLDTASSRASRRIESSSYDTPTVGSVSNYDSEFSRKQDDAGYHTDYKPRATANTNRKHLQPLKLPPLNLLPLSAPMANKIDSLQNRAHPAGNSATRTLDTPPPRQFPSKTPSTPMTASKASFFSHELHDPDASALPQSRSNSSQFALRMDTAGFRTQNSASALDSLEIPSHNRTISPYMSSSLPKNSGDFGYLRNQTGGKLTGPRPQTQVSTFSPLSENIDVDQQPTSEAAPEGNDPSNSTIDPSKKKTTTSATPDPTIDLAKYDNMPPPKLPASATWSNLSTTRQSPISKPTYLNSRRKLSTVSATNGAPQPRSQPEQNLKLTTNVPSESTDMEPAPKSSSSILSPVHKLLGGGRQSTTKLRPQDQNLDQNDQAAEEEMRKLGSKRKGFETAAKELDELRRKASPKERVSPAQALKMANLNIFERGEIIDFKDIFFCGTHKAKKHIGDLNAQTANFGYDDDRGDYNIVVGDHLAYRYEIVDVLGKGSFGQVVRCVDHKTGGLVAVKIIRNKKRFHQQALVEVNILQKLKDWDPHMRHNVVNFTQSFYFRGHLCISTELLDMNLYEFIKAHDFKGFSLRLIRRFTKQMLNTLVLLHSHKVIHCDLKPENVLLAHPMHSEIKVIDFGSSCFENEKVYTYIQSRFYRSPEVILGMSYGMPIDMWSLGCILAELYTGYPLFPGENEQEQLACIMEVFGPPEKHLIEKSTRKKLFFDSMGKPRLTVSSKGRRRRPSSKDLRQALKCDDEAFIDFITRCLKWDPARRMNPHDALNHEFTLGLKLNPRTRAQHAALNNSAAKRITSTASAGARPLPDPPASLKSTTASRARDASNNSPIKPSAAASKRHSTVGSGSVSNVTTTASGAAKRTSNNNPMSGSALPRVTGRSTSGKPDLATAAAATSLVS